VILPNQYRFLRLKIWETRSGYLPQLSQVVFCDMFGQTVLPINATSQYPGLHQTERAANLIRGDYSKWYAGQNDANIENHQPYTSFLNLAIEVTFEFRNPVKLSQYLFVTANDVPERDPTKWIWEISNNGTTFFHFAVHSVGIPPMSRYSQYVGKFFQHTR